MSTMSALIHHGNETGIFTREQRDALPDDGNRYELVDGMLIVTPAPLIRHQRAVTRLIPKLAGQVPPQFELLCAPCDVSPQPGTVVQPDVLIARVSDLTERDLPTAPLLAIEVLSPTTQRYDLTLKRAVYEEMGCPAYWVVDPTIPSIRAWHLENGRYGEPVVTTGFDTFAVTTPFPLRIRPADLT